MDKSDTRKKIFMAAAKLFSRQGYYNVSVNEICEAAGVTKPSLYYYFNDKEDLLLALANEAHQVVEDLSKKYLAEENSFLKNLDNMNQLYLHYTKEYAYLIPFSFWVQFVPLPDKIKKMLSARIKIRWEYLNSLFQRGQKEGYLDPDLNTSNLMRSLLNPLSVMVVQNVLSGQKDTFLETSLNEYFEFWKKQFVKPIKKQDSPK